MDKYYVIDPCYVVKNNEWDAQWAIPEMTIEKFNLWLEIEFDAVIFDNFGGDCLYNGIGVDSGCIAVMPITDKLEIPTIGLFRTFDNKEDAIDFATKWVKEVLGEF